MIYRSQTPRRRRWPIAVALTLAALLVLLGLYLLRPAARWTASHPGPAATALILDEKWSDWFLLEHSQKEQQAYLEDTVHKAKAQGADLLLLTGRAGSGALFRTRDEDMPTLETISANDRLLHLDFDPVLALAELAGREDLSVELLGAGPDGQTLAPGQLDALPAAVAEFADDHDFLVFTARPDPENEALTVYEAEDWVLLEAPDSPGLLAALAMQSPDTGVVLGTMSDVKAGSESIRLYQSFTTDLEDCRRNGVAQLLPLPVPRTLSITYPAPEDVLYTDQVFLMGTSDPAQPLTVAGQPVERRGADGVWGLLIEVQPGENVITAEQGGQTAQLTFTREESTWTPQKPKPDGSQPAAPGQKLRITSPLASVLRDPEDPDSIAMTAYEGAVDVIQKSEQVVTGNKLTYAYLLESGHYVLSKDCELLEGEVPDAQFSGLTVETLENGDEILRFEGEGTPLYYHEWEDDTLRLSFDAAEFTGQLPERTEFVTGFELDTQPRGFSIVMHFDPAQPLWGWHVEYLDGSTQIYLKRAPDLSDAETGPLTGVTVMLDPGHGDQDNGAMGCAGPDAPQEKHVNLALSIAARHRLEQLGATVLMTRSEDSFPTLADRLRMLNSEKPDFFISVHHNSSLLTTDLNESGGVEAYWFYTEGKPLADHLVDALGETTGRTRRGSFYNYFYVTRSSICPAVLLEAGFMTVPQEYASITDETMLWAEAGAIAQAVLDSVPR